MKREVGGAVALLGDLSERHGGEACPRQAVEQPEDIGAECRCGNCIKHAELSQGAGRIRPKLDAGPGLVGKS